MTVNLTVEAVVKPIHTRDGVRYGVEIIVPTYHTTRRAFFSMKSLEQANERPDSYMLSFRENGTPAFSGGADTMFLGTREEAEAVRHLGLTMGLKARCTDGTDY